MKIIVIQLNDDGTVTFHTDLSDTEKQIIRTALSYQPSPSLKSKVWHASNKVIEDKEQTVVEFFDAMQHFLEAEGFDGSVIEELKHDHVENTSYYGKFRKWLAKWRKENGM